MTLTPTVLHSREMIRREFFDPKNEQHVESMKAFVRTGNWGNVQFFCEHPYTDVPTTVFMHYLEHHLNVQRDRSFWFPNETATDAVS